MSEHQVELIHGLSATFKAAQWDGIDRTGFLPVGPQVIVLCDECSEVTSGLSAEKIGEQGKGVYLPANMIETMNAGAEQGTIVSVSEGAFRIYEDGQRWTGYKPQPGDRVYFEKYAGHLLRGVDDRVYRVMDYKQIGGIYKRDGQIYSGEQ